MAERIRTRIPDEVRLVAEVMYCQAARCYYDTRHPCIYFKRWGRYPSYDWETDATEDELKASYKGTATATAVYAGRRYLVPELLAGCRKAPVMMAGLNPNLPTFFRNNYRFIYPYFDDIFQYAYHFRYRTAYKRQVTEAFFDAHKSGREYNYPPGYKGENARKLPRLSLQRGATAETEISYVKMYEAYAGLVHDFRAHADVGMPTYDEPIRYFDDFSYYNMVACPSPRWDAKSFGEGGFDSEEDKQRVTDECLKHERRGYFYYQFLQSRPKVLVVFGDSMKKNIVSVLRDFFLGEVPAPEMKISLLLKEGPFYVQFAEGEVEFKTRLIFSYHASGSPKFKPYRGAVVDAMAEEFRLGNLRPNAAGDGLLRTPGRCFFCNNSLFRTEEGCAFKDAFEDDVDAVARNLYLGTARGIREFADTGVRLKEAAAGAAAGDAAALSSSAPARADKYISALKRGEYYKRVTKAGASEIESDNDARSVVVTELQRRTS